MGFVSHQEKEALIILHARGENGWIDGDYHNEMSAVHFEEWFHDSLIPNLQRKSLTVMDNAPITVGCWNLCLP